jgi:hypothetical protein
MTGTTVVEADTGERAQTAAELLASVVDDKTMATMAAQVRSSGVALMGEGGFDAADVQAFPGGAASG